LSPASAPRALPPNSTIGIFGGGQLGKMLAQAAAKLGYRAAVLDVGADAPAMRVAQTRVVAEYSDIAAARRLAQAADVLTYEFENIALKTIEAAAELKPVYPGASALKTAQNRLREKILLANAGVPIADYRPVNDFAQLRAAVDELGAPGILKTTTLGYDGKGQWRINAPSDIAAAMITGAMVYEKAVDFELECSVILARDAGGEMSVFPIAENRHVNGILDASIAPARIGAAQRADALKIARKIALALDLRGLLAVEMFVAKDGRVLVNELAPRPHNSGHFTLEACAVSQFEQLARVMVGLPLAAAELIRPAAMVNLMGELWLEARGEPAWHTLADSRASLHIYGKAPPKKGRKMGHLTVLADDPQTALAEALEARRRLTA